MTGTVTPATGTVLTPDACRSLALALALRGIGHVSPNPLVGCVLVDHDHRFLGAGGHYVYGQLHAEANAVRQVEEAKLTSRLAGATAYVTLEPCAHHGKTAPCADLLVRHRISKVIYAVADPNPEVNGRGVAILKAQGVETFQDRTWQQACESVAEVYLWNRRHNLPFVGLKVAAAANGAVARHGDQRHWITGERARHYGHYLRMRYDAVLVGAATALADNPTLNVRHPRINGRTPLRVILDPDGETLTASASRDLNLFSLEPHRTILFLTAAQASHPAAQRLQTAGVALATLPLVDSPTKPLWFSWRSVLETLQKKGVQSILIEGGARTYAHALAVGIVQKLHYFRAPTALTGPNLLFFDEGRPPDQGSLTLRNSETIELGQDRLIEADLSSC